MRKSISTRGPIAKSLKQFCGNSNLNNPVMKKKLLKKSEVLKEGRNNGIRVAITAIRNLLAESSSGLDYGNNIAQLDDQWSDQFDKEEAKKSLTPPSKPIHPSQKPFMKRPAKPAYMTRNVPFPEVEDDTPAHSPIPATVGPGPMPAPAPEPVPAIPGPAVPEIIDAVIEDQKDEIEIEEPKPEYSKVVRGEVDTISADNEDMDKWESADDEEKVEQMAKNPEYSRYPYEVLRLTAPGVTHKYTIDQWDEFFESLEDLGLIMKFGVDNDYYFSKAYGDDEATAEFLNLKDKEKYPKDFIG